MCVYVFVWVYAVQNNDTILGKSARFAYSQESVRSCVFVCMSATIASTGPTLAKVRRLKNGGCRFCHLPSNGVIAKFHIVILTYFLKVKY